MDQAFADIGGAHATELLSVFSSILEVRSHKRKPEEAWLRRVPTIASRQSDLGHALGDIKAIIDKPNLTEQYVTIFDKTVNRTQSCSRMSGVNLFRHRSS